MFRFAQHDKRITSLLSFWAKRRISDHFFYLPCSITELWLLFPIVTQIEPSWVRLFDKGDLPAAAPTFQFLLAGDRITDVSKVLNPNQPVQTIAFRETLYVSMPVLVQTACNVIRNPDIQCRIAFVGENVHPIVVIAHAVGGNQRCFASLNMTQGSASKIQREFFWIFDAFLHFY